MKALTIRHPWPWAACYFGKPLENRTWKPSPAQLKPGERFAIHAGKMPSVMEIVEAFEAMREMRAIERETKTPLFSQLKTQESSIVAVATYGGVVTESQSPWFVGPYGWGLLGPRGDQPLIVLPSPVPCRGAQGLWEVPADVLEQMRAQVRRTP